MSFGFEIPNFSLVRELGMGGPAPVFLADQAGLDRQAALRILRVEHSGRAPELVQLFEQESRLLARVQHRNVVRIYQIGATDSVLFRAMEYLEAGSLLDRMRARELTPVQAVNYCAQLAQALHAVHALNAFVHELRPASILFRDARTPVLADLGMVRATTLDPGEAAPRYPSPEQLSGQPADARSNVYALGLLLHCMLTGEFPGPVQEPAAGGEAPSAERLKPLPAEVAGLQPVLARMLAGAPTQRYQDMPEVYAALAAAVPLEGDLTAASFEVPAPDRLRRVSLRVLALAAVPLMLAAAFAVWHWLPQGLDEAEIGRLQQGLQEFETYMARMDIYGPAGTNATAALEELLEIARERPEVREAAQRLADIYLHDAYDSYLRKNLEDALRLTGKGLEFAPEHAELRQLQAEANKALAAMTLQRLLAQGEDALARLNLLPPMPGNAYSLFMEVRSMDPGNRTADAGLREIQLRIAEQARAAWGAEGPERAHEIAAEGLELFPDSVLLNDLLADLEHARPAD